MISEAYLPAALEESIDRLRYLTPWLSRTGVASLIAVLLPSKVSVLMPTTSPPIDLIASFNSLSLDIGIYHNSTITLPNEYYEGISIYIDLNTLSEEPPELLKNTGITGNSILDKFCKDENFSAFIGNEETDAIFSSFYHQPKEFQLAYWRIKVIELLLYLSKLSFDTENRLSEYQSEQVELVRSIHKYLLDNISQRITIDEMARKYLINPTTLKSVFKAVYGTSIASHIKEHRMKFAARLLMETPKSIKEIAKEVGYESQSKFSKAFKEYYDVLPTEYRIFHSNKLK